MKKSLLTLAAVLLFGAAQSQAKATISLDDYTPKATRNVLADKRAPIKAEKQAKKEGLMRGPSESGYDICFSGDIENWYYASNKNNCTYKCYIYIPADIATALAGNQITDITFSAALANSSATRDGSVFVSEDINAEPVTSTKVKVIDSYTASKTNNQTVTLETPYTIKEDTPFYFGYIVEKCKLSTLTGLIDYPIGVGAGSVNRFAGNVVVYDSKGELLSEIDMVEDVGENLYLKAVTVGDQKSVENIFSIKGGFIDTFTMPVTNQTKDKKAKIVIENIGTNDLTVLDYTAVVKNGETINATLDIKIAGGKTDVAELPLPDLVFGKGLVHLGINTINGVECESEMLFPYIALDNDGYDRKLLVEEGTGTWCGWCPRGIVGFEYMEKNYADKFIGIAAHYNDNMYTESYLPLFQYYIDGFPNCVINRDPYFIDDPNAENLEYMAQIWETQLGAAEGAFKDIKIEESVIKVTTSTKFAYDDPESMVCVAVAILENDIPDLQTNYYAGGQYGECGGWEKYPETQPWMFQHVARNIDEFFGVEGSLPAEVAKGQEYTSSAELPLDNITDINKTSLVAILFDMWSGTVLNAAKIDAADYNNLSGISDIIAPAVDAPVEYFNLQGVRMQQGDMPTGIYIKRQGSSASKAIIK